MSYPSPHLKRGGEALCIPLGGERGRGLYVVLDAEDHARFGRHRWCLDSGGYPRRASSRASGPRHHIYLHREILGLVFGDGKQGEHINGDTLDCRRTNLRVADHALNQQNLTRLNANSISGYRGVSWDKERGKWEAHAGLDGRKHFLGRFSTPEEAAAVASAFRAERMPFSPDARTVAA
jgi:hypothetical protein